MQVVLSLGHVAQAEIVRGIDGAFDRDVVLQLGHAETLESIDIFDRETFKDGTDIRVEDGQILPHFDGENQGTEE